MSTQELDSVSGAWMAKTDYFREKGTFLAGVSYVVAGKSKKRRNPGPFSRHRVLVGVKDWAYSWCQTNGAKTGHDMGQAPHQSIVCVLSRGRVHLLKTESGTGGGVDSWLAADDG